MRAPAPLEICQPSASDSHGSRKRAGLDWRLEGPQWQLEAAVRAWSGHKLEAANIFRKNPPRHPVMYPTCHLAQTRFHLFLLSPIPEDPQIRNRGTFTFFLFFSHPTNILLVMMFFCSSLHGSQPCSRTIIPWGLKKPPPASRTLS